MCISCFRVHQEADRRVFEACEGLKKELRDGLERERLQLAETLEKEFDQKKEQMVREAREVMAREHKQEMDGLRARFRLAFSTAQGMERSPSDTSLEKIGVMTLFVSFVDSIQSRFFNAHNILATERRGSAWQPEIRTGKS